MSLREHSLSIGLAAGFVASASISYFREPGTWAYDFWMMLAGSFGGSAILVVLAKWLWEKDSDPTKPT